MDLFEQINMYCERTDFSFWSEPVNAVTNAAFVIAAFTMWRRTRHSSLHITNILIINLALIGVGSFLFHTHATVWAELTDVIPIATFVLIYLFATLRDIVSLPWWGAFLGAVLFVPYAMLLTPVFQKLPFFHVSSFYWPIPVLLVGMSAYLWSKARDTAQNMLTGAGILAVSLSFRSVDQGLCAQFPIGTHFVWHCLNGVMLAWMIETYHRHMLAKHGAER